MATTYQSGSIKNGNYTLTLPSKAGTVALTSDVSGGIFESISHSSADGSSHSSRYTLTSLDVGEVGTHQLADFSGNGGDRTFTVSTPYSGSYQYFAVYGWRQGSGNGTPLSSALSGRGSGVINSDVDWMWPNNSGCTSVSVWYYRYS